MWQWHSSQDVTEAILDAISIRASMNAVSLTTVKP
jgi:hypothetical protein